MSTTAHGGGAPPLLDSRRPPCRRAPRVSASVQVSVLSLIHFLAPFPVPGRSPVSVSALIPALVLLPAVLLISVLFVALVSVFVTISVASPVCPSFSFCSSWCPSFMSNL